MVPVESAFLLGALRMIECEEPTFFEGKFPLSTRPHNWGKEMVASPTVCQGTARAGQSGGGDARPAVTVALSQTLEGWLRATSTPLGKVRRASAILLLADGVSYIEAARLVGLQARYVRK